MFEHMYLTGEKNIQNQLLNKDYWLELPPASVIGLAQVALLTYGSSENNLVLDLSNVYQTWSK